MFLEVLLEVCIYLEWLAYANPYFCCNFRYSNDHFFYFICQKILEISSSSSGARIESKSNQSWAFHYEASGIKARSAPQETSINSLLIIPQGALERNQAKSYRLSMAHMRK
jgi:hypothetical protein